MFGIAFYAGARVTVGAPAAPEDRGSANPMNTAMSLVLLLGGLFLAYRYRRCILRLLSAAWPLLLTVAVILCSVLWSQAPANTLRRSINAFTLVLFLLTTHAALGTGRFMRLTVATMLLTAAGSLVEAVVRPGVGYDVGDYANAVRGMYEQKNGLGMAMLSGTLALGYLVLARGHLRLRDGAILLAFLVLVVLSRSTTSLILVLTTAAGTVGLLWTLRGAGWRMAAGLGVAGLLAVVVPMAAVLDSTVLFDAVGKDPSLTGRTLIWEVVGDLADQRPWLGYGYAAFWIAGTDGVRTVWTLLNWEVPTAHSGFLDVRVQLGLVGVLLLATLVLHSLGWMLVSLTTGRPVVAAWMGLFLVVQAILSNGESTLLNMDLNFLTWMLMALSMATVRRPRPVGRDKFVPVPGSGRAHPPPFHGPPQVVRGVVAPPFRF